MRLLLILLLVLSSSVFSKEKTKVINLNSENTISFNQAFMPMFVAKKQIQAIKLCSSNPKSDIYVVLNSPGGSIGAGKLFFDTLEALDCNFHTVTIFSASMAYQTVQNLGTRYILPSGILMSHRASIRGLGGEVEGELDSIYNLIKKDVEDMEKVAAKRIGTSLKKYKDSIRDELWLTANEALRLNHADQIVVLNCSENLLTSRFELVRTFFGTFNVEFSNCPIITAPLSINGSKSEKEKVMYYYRNLSEYVKYTI